MNEPRLLAIDLRLHRVNGYPPRILVTGSRNWEDRDLVVRILFTAYVMLGQDELTTLVHGACPTGADKMADDVFRELGMRIEPHPADWRRWGKGAGYVRNKEMVAAGADVCLAFIRDDSKGASMCAQMAYDAGIPLRRFLA